MAEEYSFIVIGAGGVGLAAAMYGARLGLKTIVFAHSYNSGAPIGGTITMTNIVENYPGFIKTSGLYLSKLLKDHAESYDLVTIRQEEVKDASKKGKFFLVKTNKGEYVGKALLFATGTNVKKLDVKGAKKFENYGLNFCALCDAPLYKNKTVAVIGGSDAACREALILAEHAKKVYIIYRGEKIHPEEATLKLLKKEPKIEVINNTNLVEVKGTKRVEEVILDKEYKESKELSLDGVYVAIGRTPISDLARLLGVKLNEKKEIIIDHKTSETNLPGVFAAGDVTNKPFKQLIIGVAEGCTAAYSAFEYIKANF